MRIITRHYRLPTLAALAAACAVALAAQPACCDAADDEAPTVPVGEHSILQPGPADENGQTIGGADVPPDAMIAAPHGPHSGGLPAGHRKRLTPLWAQPTIFEHLHAFRKQREQLPPHFRHSSHHGRHLGVGEPLEGTSWSNRPWHFSWFFGELYGDDLIGGRVGQGGDIFGGYRFGYDLDHYWGAEGRFAFANLPLSDAQAPPQPRTSRDWFWDAHVVYYPWGDSRWRPYASAGLGLAQFRFVDELQQSHNTALVHFPLGIGLKYQWKKWLVVRVDAMDNIAFGGGGLDTMQNFSLSFGLEWRFGGRKTSYWPYDPSLHLW